jgi:hypothetical protein
MNFIKAIQELTTSEFIELMPEAAACPITTQARIVKFLESLEERAKLLDVNHCQNLSKQIRAVVILPETIEKLKHSIKNNEPECIFNRCYDVNNDDGTKLNDTQATALRDLGYRVDYNRGCMWYEVSGWTE